MQSFSILTINAALQDVRIFSLSLYRPLDYIHERMKGLVADIKAIQPDIVCVQELFHHDLQQAFYKDLLREYPHATGFGKKGFKFRLDNELITLSRFPLSRPRFIRFKHAPREEKIFINRGMMCMDLEIPSLGTLQLLNVHLTAGGLRQHPEEPVMESIRSAQIQQLLEYISVNSPVLIAGDFNTGPGSSPDNYSQLLAGGIIDTFSLAGGVGMSWDPDNPLVSDHCPLGLPPQRVDHILINNRLNKILSVKNADIVLKENRLQVDTERQIPVSDHYGVLVNFMIP